LNLLDMVFSLDSGSGPQSAHHLFHRDAPTGIGEARRRRRPM